MDYYRIRIINTDGRISVRDKAFSQTIEMLNGLSVQQQNDFWNKREVILPCGSSVVFVKEV